MRLREGALLTMLMVTLVSAAEEFSSSSTAEDEEFEDRDKRQTQAYFTSGLQGVNFRPTPKPQPFTGPIQQTGIPRYQVQGFPGNPPQGFRTVAPVGEDADDIDRNTVSVSPTPHPLVLRPQHQTPQPQQYRNTPTAAPQQILVRRPNQEQQRQQQQDYRNKPVQLQGGQRYSKFPQQQLTEEQLEELEEEKEEPDRLQVLLPQSKFACHGRNTGYYADEGLNCEVFHYCQDNARHSWVCPEGFLFHQVHLICMPPSSDNICKQSSQYHFINDYLYRVINEEEFRTKPNITLRYSERYYPENYYAEEEGESRPVPSAVPPHKTPLNRPQQQQQQQQQAPRSQQPQALRPTPTPQQFRINNQVFHSPEEVNIPLQHRRPVSPQPQRTLYPTPSSEEYEY